MSRLRPITPAVMRCADCLRWEPSPYSRVTLGTCDARPGVLKTWSGPEHACDVNNGRAFVPLVVIEGKGA